VPLSELLTPLLLLLSTFLRGVKETAAITVGAMGLLLGSTVCICAMALNSIKLACIVAGSSVCVGG